MSLVTAAAGRLVVSAAWFINHSLTQSAHSPYALDIGSLNATCLLPYRLQ